MNNNWNDINRALVIVPHQDDEVMLAGNTIIKMRKLGIEVFVLFSTNGDWKYNAKTRIHEAKRSLKILGNISDDHILLLGYGDNYNSSQHFHYYYSESGMVTCKSGHYETYGADEIDDFAYKHRHEHSTYNRKNFERDLKDAIIAIYPDLIICIDFDEHPDHRILTLSFDKVMGELLRTQRSFRPVILKGFAYCNAYTAIPDLFSTELQNTVRPQIGITGKYQFDIIDSSIYEWDKRVQIYAGNESRSRNLLVNKKAKALAKHRSQYVILKADRIINNDEVFWVRRTDSLSYAAEVSVTSGIASYLNDFRLYNVDITEDNYLTQELKFHMKKDSDEAFTLISETKDKIQTTVGKVTHKTTDKVKVDEDGDYVSKSSQSDKIVLLISIKNIYVGK